MPVTAEETLAKLIVATEEARATIRELHESRAAALDVMKKQRQVITDTIVREVENQVGQLATEASDDLRARAGKVIDELAADWRTKLGLA